MSEPLQFIPLHYGEKLTVINPIGTVAVVTLWSKTDYIARMLEERGVDLSPSSPIAVFGNLFGEGLRYLLRNLLYNPQIDTLMLLGNNLTGSADRLEDFFTKGIEPVNAAIEYVKDDDGDAFPCRIIGSNQILDNRVRPESFVRPPHIWRPNDRKYLPAGLDEAARYLLQEYQPSRSLIFGRVAVSVPQVKSEFCPSDLDNHGIVAEDALDAWKIMLRKVLRFGKKVELAGVQERKIRKELRNFHAVILNPRYDETLLEKEEEIAEGEIEKIRKYRREILDGVVPPDQPYTYGNRLRAYYNRDLLKEIGLSLRVVPIENAGDGNPDNRKHFISLWDSFHDFPSLSPESGESHNKPCLVTIFFRKDEGKIHLTACFRSHNASNAWLWNIYGLMAVQDFVCECAGAHSGSISVISYSLGLDMRNQERAKKIAVSLPPKFRQDPNGYIEVRVEKGVVVVEHKSLEAGVIASYTAETREEMFAQLSCDDVFSQIDHALYAGAEIQRAFSCLREGKEFIQDNA